MSYMTDANAIADQLRGIHIPRQRGGKRQRETASEKQLKILAFMRAFFKENDQLPPVAVIASKFGMNPNGADWHVQALVRLGRLERNAVGKLRFARAATPTQGGARE